MSEDKLRRILALLWAALYEHASEEAPPTTDRRLLRALELMRDRLAEPWTVESLARAAGMSRAAFARLFSETLGTSPLQHLHEQRMRHAAELLTTSDESLARIAERVGYQSEFAFSRAFKRHHGEAPGAYRRRGASSTRMSLAA